VRGQDATARGPRGSERSPWIKYRDDLSGIGGPKEKNISDHTEAVLKEIANSAATKEEKVLAKRVLRKNRRGLGVT